MSFKSITYDNQKFQNILSRTIKNKQLNEFIELINKPYIAISGSSILELVSNDNWQGSDIDLYIDISKIKDTENLTKLLKYLFINYENEYKSKNGYKLLSQILTKKLYHINRTTNPEYINETLSKYIKYYLRFTDKNKKIELIFISCDIETLLLNTFDYDIVKNYWKQNEVYVNNIHNINSKIACMSLKHFIIRILQNKNEFDNFIKRYNKYTQRGYKLFIHKTLLTNDLINKIYALKYNTPIASLYYQQHTPKSFNIIYNTKIECEYIDITINHNFKFKKYMVDKNLYIIKMLLITGIYNKNKIIKKLNTYSNFLLDKYLNPDSLFIINKFNNTEKNKKGVYYIQNDDPQDKSLGMQMKLFTIS
jgi:hypothetical protein